MKKKNEEKEIEEGGGGLEEKAGTENSKTRRKEKRRTWRKGAEKEEAKVGKERRSQVDLTTCGMAETVLSSGTR